MEINEITGSKSVKIKRKKLVQRLNARDQAKVEHAIKRYEQMAKNARPSYYNNGER